MIVDMPPEWSLANRVGDQEKMLTIRPTQANGSVASGRSRLDVRAANELYWKMLT